MERPPSRSRAQVTGIVLRDYQKPIADEVMARLKAGEREVCMACCPGFGKTEVAIEIISRLLADGWAGSVLVIAQARIELLDNFAERLDRLRPDLVGRVHVAMATEWKATSREKWDLIVVDEAHTFYEVPGGMIARTVESVAPKAVLLLTGSPGCFIRRGVKPVICSLSEVFHAGYASDVRVLIGTSSDNITEKDWTEDGEIKRSVATTEKGTTHAMAMVARALPLLASQKTIIACRDMKAADQTTTWLKKRKIEALLSHHKEDVDADTVRRFKSGAGSVLVVVNRATLGFDMPQLENFVDLTYSRNPERVFQMFCRVVRKSEGALDKRFMKVMPNVFQVEHFRFFMSGVLNLSRRELFAEWGAGSLWRLPCPAKITDTSCGDRSQQSVRPSFESGMMVFGDLFVDVADVPRGAAVTLGECVGKRNADAAARKAEIIAFREATGRFPSTRRGADSREVMLARAMRHYCYEGDGSFDNAFRAKAVALGWKSGRLTTIEVDGAKKSPEEWAESAGLPPLLIRNRYAKGIRGARLLQPLHSLRGIHEVDGKKLRLSEIARLHRLPLKLLQNRAKAGKRGDELVAVPRTVALQIKLDGEVYTCRALARKAGVSTATMWGRWKSGLRGHDLLTRKRRRRAT